MTAKIKKSTKTSAKATKSASLVKTKTPVKTKLVEQSASQTLTPAVSVKKPEPKVQTRYIFIRNEKSNPVGCMAYQAVLTDTGYLIRYGLSCFNPLDHFDRKIGRLTAADRMIHGLNDSLKQRHPEMIGSCMLNASNLQGALKELFFNLKDKNLPTRLRKRMEGMAFRVTFGNPRSDLLVATQS